MQHIYFSLQIQSPESTKRESKITIARVDLETLLCTAFVVRYRSRPKMFSTILLVNEIDGYVPPYNALHRGALHHPGSSQAGHKAHKTCTYVHAYIYRYKTIMVTSQLNVAKLVINIHMHDVNLL